MNKWMQLANRIGFSNCSFIAFTLAETLIVMGIIGVVAALTIPNLNSSTNNMEKVTKVKKIYAELNEAHNRATAVYGPVETWFVNDGCTVFSNNPTCTKRYFNRIIEFMKTSKSCIDSDNGCYTSSGKNLYGGNNTYSTYPSAILAGGSSILIQNIACPNCNCNGDGYAGIYCGYIRVDIDGPNKGKNTEGIDIFNFDLTKDGILPTGGGSSWVDNIIKNGCFYQGHYCAAWVISNGNMDYIDASHTSAHDAGVCKNNHQLSIAEPSCK